MNPRDARGRMSITGRSHACSDRSGGIENAGIERKTEEMEGRETGKTNDSTRARIVVERGQPKRKRREREETRARGKRREIGPLIAWLFRGQTRIFYIRTSAGAVSTCYHNRIQKRGEKGRKGTRKLKLPATDHAIRTMRGTMIRTREKIYQQQI